MNKLFEATAKETRKRFGQPEKHYADEPKGHTAELGKLQADDARGLERGRKGWAAPSILIPRKTANSTWDVTT